MGIKAFLFTTLLVRAVRSSTPSPLDQVPDCCKSVPISCSANEAELCQVAFDGMTLHTGPSWTISPRQLRKEDPPTPGPLLPWSQCIGPPIMQPAGVPRCCDNDSCPTPLRPLCQTVSLRSRVTNVVNAQVIFKEVEFELKNGESKIVQVVADPTVAKNFILYETAKRLQLGSFIQTLNKTEAGSVQVGDRQVQVTQIVGAEIFTGYRSVETIFGVIPSVTFENSSTADLILGVGFLQDAGVLLIDTTLFGIGTPDSIDDDSGVLHSEL